VDVSVVIPIYNERDNVEPLLKELLASPMAGDVCEVIFVDDGSDDGTTRIIERLCANDPRVKAIVFRRNFGKSSALDAGFRQAKGDVVVTLDGDLQDDPNEIPNLLKRLDEGYDLVSGWKRDRQDPPTKTLPSLFFNAVVRTFSAVKIHDFNCGLKAYRSEVVRELNLYGEQHRFIPILANNRGFRVGEIPVRHRRRIHGKSKFGPRRLLRGFFDFITVAFLSRYNHRPLHLFGFWGVLMFAVGTIINVYLTAMWFLGHALSNRPMLVFATLLMIVGFQSVSLGLLSEMVASMRPGRSHYSVRKRINSEEE